MARGKGDKRSSERELVRRSSSAWSTSWFGVHQKRHDAKRDRSKQRETIFWLKQIIPLWIVLAFLAWWLKP